MRLKAVSGIMLTLLLIGMLTLAFNVQPVKASGTIYIRSDGSVDPPTANITTVDNVTYTFTSNINDSIVVERDDIIIDGNGYTVQGTRTGSGLDLSHRNNVTVKNTKVTRFTYGIYLYNSSRNTLTGNTASNNDVGIFAGWGHYSSNNMLIANSASNNSVGGISLHYSSNNTLISNTASGNLWNGISINGFSNTLLNNTASNNVWGEGLSLGFSSNNTLANNRALNNHVGIKFYGVCSDNKIFHNNFVENWVQAIVSTRGYVNIWDNGYPSGGNYWSDYTGVDVYSGPYQNEAGSDGIGDTPYIINGTNQDNYPLMYAWGATITLTPDEGPTGAVIDVAGRGFTPYGVITSVTIDATPVPLIENKTIDATGNFSGKLVIPTVAVGAYNITVTDNASLTATLLFTVTGTTKITVSPGSGVPGDLITISGENFTAIADTIGTVTLNTTPPTPVGTFSTDSDGRFSKIFTVPALPTGPYTVTATDANGLEATADFTIAITLIVLDPTEGPTGTVVTITGYGFTTTDTPTANVTIDTTLVLENILVSTLHAGTTFIVPTLPVGTYTVTAMDSEGLTASTSFQVTKMPYTLTIYSSPTGVTFTVDSVSHTTPWSGTYSENTSVSLVMPQTHNGYVWSHWLEDGDPNRIKTVTMDTNITLTGVYTAKPVGGKATPINIPMNKPETPALWIWLSTIILPLIATAVFVKLKKKKQ